MSAELARMIEQATILPLTAWVGMKVMDGSFYAFFRAGPQSYGLMMGPPKVLEGIEMARRGLMGGGILPIGKPPGQH